MQYLELSLPFVSQLPTSPVFSLLSKGQMKLSSKRERGRELETETQRLSQTESRGNVSNSFLFCGKEFTPSRYERNHFLKIFQICSVK
jgi:hypothetical protein